MFGKIVATSIAIGAASVIGTGTAQASSEPVWAAMTFTPGQEVEMRLLLSGINRQFQPQIISTANEVCRVIRAGGTAENVSQTLAEAGYLDYQRDKAGAIMVDVFCP